jgi:glycosyltransferase involved in cell wall biosynthesis
MPDDNPAAAFSIVCLSPQEWAVTLPTNRQQIMRRAAERGHPVLFVETGDFFGAHLLRLIRRPGRLSLLRRLVSGEQVSPGITVRKALNVLPWGQRYRISSAVNGRISAWVIGRAARRLPHPRVTWLYDPRGTWAIGAVGDVFGVYDCVDDYTEQAEARNRALVAEADRRAGLLSRLVFTTSTPLYDRHLRDNPRTYLVRNVGDFAHFSPATDRERALPELRELPRPVQGFAGNFLPGKVDFDLLDDLVGSLQQGSIVLAGPATSPQVARQLDEAARHPNVVWLGPVSYDKLPAVVASFDVGLIPYEENEYTRSCFPLKLFEYLAAGKPVVASGLPELEGMEPDVVVASGSAAFQAAVDAAAENGSAGDVDRRQAIAAANTWESRTSRLLSLVSEELEA